MLVLNEIFALTGVQRFGLVTPDRDDVQATIVANCASADFECVAERHLRKCDNFSFPEVPAGEIRATVRETVEQQVIWNAVESGVFQVFSSVHAPFTPCEGLRLHA